MNSIVRGCQEIYRRWSKDRALAIWIAAILAVLVRVALSLLYATYQFDPARDYWDFGHEWGRIAKWLVQTGMFSLDGKVPTADTDPLYIWVIALFFHVLGVFTTSAGLALVVFQSLLCGLTTWAIFVLTERLYGQNEARISALLYAFYPASIFFAINRVAPSSLSVLLLCLIFLVVLAVPKSRGIALAVLSGLLIGLVVLSSSDNLSLFLVVPAWLVFLTRYQGSRLVLKAIIVVGVGLLVMLPWSMRNSSAIGEATISKGNLGFHLWVGNNPNATGFYQTSTPPELLADRHHQEKQSQYYAKAISWIVENPGRFLMLTLKRIQFFWYVIEGRGSRNELFQGWLLLTMAACAILGGLFRRSGSAGVKLLWLFVAVYPLVFYFTHASFYRHRYHLEPFVLILASNGLMYLWALLSSQRQNTAVRPADLSMSEGS